MLSNYDNHIYANNTGKQYFSCVCVLNLLVDLLKHYEMAQRAVYFPGFERCDFEELIEMVGSGNPDEIEPFNQWREQLRYLENENEALWYTFYFDLRQFSGDYPDDESLDHALDVFTSRYEDLIRIVSFIFDPVEQDNVKQFFQQKLNECPAEVPI